MLDQLDRHLRHTFDLTLAEYELLVRLSEAPDQRIRMSRLADCVSHSRSRTSHTVSRLARDGLVKRTRCPEDGRGTYAVLTAGGLARLRSAAPVHAQEVRRLVFDRPDKDDLLAAQKVFESVVCAADENATDR